MELALIWFFTFAVMGNEIETLNDKNVELNTHVVAQDVRMNSLETTLLRTVGSHSALSAKHNVETDRIEERIDFLEANTPVLQTQNSD